MQVYVEVSKNHNIPIEQVIREKFRPPIRLLIMYYNHVLRLEQKEYKKMENEMKQHENNSREVNL